MAIWADKSYLVGDTVSMLQAVLDRVQAAFCNVGVAWTFLRNDDFAEGVALALSGGHARLWWHLRYKVVHRECEAWKVWHPRRARVALLS